MADTTTVADLIKRVRNHLHEQLNDYFLQTTLTAAGTTTTFKPSGSVGTNYFSDQNMEVVFVDGVNAGLRGQIVSWDGTTATLLEALPFATEVDKVVQIGQKGFFSDHDLIYFLNDAANFVFRAIVAARLSEYQKSASQSGTPVSGENYGQVTHPTDLIGRPARIWIDGREAAILNDDELEILVRGILIDRAFLLVDSTTGYFKPKPDTTATVRYRYVARPQSAVINSSVDWPMKTLAAIVHKATSAGYAKRERPDMVTTHLNLAMAQIKAINENLER